KYTDPAGNTISYEYDTKHNLIRVRDDGNIIKAISYDTQDRVTSYTEQGGTYHLYYYSGYTRVRDPRGYDTYYYFNDTGNLIKKLDPSGDYTTFLWDSNKNLTSHTDPSGYKVSYTFDAFGNLLMGKDSEGNILSYTYDENHHVVSITDQFGRTKKFTYDLKGNITSITDEGGNTSTYVYDSHGNIISETDPLGRITRYEYNSYGQITKIIDPLGNEYSYSYDILGNLLSITDPLGNSLHFEYDINGRLIKATDSEGNSRILSYDSQGNIISSTDQLGNNVAMEYDTYGRLTKITTADGSSYSRTYDAMGNVIKEIDLNGNVTQYFYDQLNRLIRIDTSLGSISYKYNKAGKITSTTDFKGLSTTFTYDIHGRISKVTYPDGKSISYSYDQFGNLIQASDGICTVSFEYDELNRVIKKSINIQGLPTKTIQYVYGGCTRNGCNITSVIDPDGGVTTYEYDANNHTVKITTPLGEETNFTYDEVGRLIQIAYPNGITTTFSYTPLGYILSVEHRKSTREIIKKYEYTYDLAGNVISVKDSEGNITQYTYDNRHRLIKVKYSDGTETKYSYDPMGNRLSVTYNGDTINYSYGSSGKLIKVGDTIYNYDRNGNLTSKTIPSGTTTYTYNGANQLIKVSYPDGSYNSFAYNPIGERYMENVNGKITYLIYDRGHVLMELDSDGNTIRRYTIGLSGPISFHEEEKSYFYLKDAIDSIVGVISGNGTLVNSYEYGPFGNVLKEMEGISNYFKYLSVRAIPSGLYHCWMRYYDSSIGRFISPEIPMPISSSDLYIPQNPYVYANNNPLSFADPSGTIAVGTGFTLSSGCRLPTPLSPLINAKISATYRFACCLDENNCGKRCGHLVRVCIGLCHGFRKLMKKWAIPKTPRFRLQPIWVGSCSCIPSVGISLCGYVEFLFYSCRLCYNLFRGTIGGGCTKELWVSIAAGVDFCGLKWFGI
ncbi:MAG TPA: hypothetical protein ENG48_05135, partial [Candidatus Atribacteria bacterium]|nr:hypothetical protein [Candidatus Atribacteria bacterium]